MSPGNSTWYRGCPAMLSHFIPMYTMEICVQHCRFHCSTSRNCTRRRANCKGTYQPAVHITKPTKRKSRATAEATFLRVCHKPLLNLQRQHMKLQSRELANNNVSSRCVRLTQHSMPGLRRPPVLHTQWQMLDHPLPTDSWFAYGTMYADICRCAK